MLTFRKSQLTLFVLFTFIRFCPANNLRQISNIENLSNNSIESLYQDSSGKLWIGTCDGLNIYNGRDVTVYQPQDKSLSLSGNIIDQIIETDKEVLWLQTYYGLNKLDRTNNTVTYFNEFKQNLFMAKDKRNILYIIQDDNYIQYYDEKSEAFKILTFPGISIQNLLAFIIDKDNRLWLFSKNGNIRLFNIIYTPHAINFKEIQQPNHPTSLKYCFYSGNDVIMIDADYKLYTLNLHNMRKELHYDVKKMIEENGEVSAIIRSTENIFIGFKTNGVKVLVKSTDHQGYELTTLPIDCGVFSLLKDRNQDLVWIGTDGQGVYIYSNDLYSIQSLKLKDYIHQIGKPIRSIYKDSEKNLWIGTKGDGIIKIQNHNLTTQLNNKSLEIINTENSQLYDNSIYCTRPSKKDILWIGTEFGLNYYSYSERKIKKVELNDGDLPIIYIHDIYEQDSILWLATVGMGIVKSRLKWINNQPVLSHTERIVINNGDIGSNYFFSIYPENDSIIWFANRGYGAFKVKAETLKYDRLTFSNRENNRLLDEIFTLTKKGDYMYFGTSAGLIKYESPNNFKIHDNRLGFPNNTIHSILQDNSDDSFWLATNRGLINFQPEQETFRNYGLNDGLSVIEFSDGAAFHDSINNIMYMGGVNGFVTVHRNRSFDNEYMPKLTFDNLSIYGEKVNLNNFIKKKNGEQVLKLKYNQNFITLEVNAIDFLNANNYTFMYKTEETKEVWINNGNSNLIPLSNLNHGKHKLQVKYVNRIVGKSSPEQTLIIQISPPWYLSQAAHITYYVLLIIAMAFVVQYLRLRNIKKRQQFLRRIKAQHKENLYESKLSFFTNIAHEFCTPLTLIYGPCNQILDQETHNDKTKKYAQVILRNAKRLNSLIQDLIEFRKIETDNKPPQIEALNISEIVNEVAYSFVEFANAKEAKFYKTIPHDMIWNSDRNYITTIVTNLLSNAFKYMSESGCVEIEVKQEHEQLIIRISNTGKGIKEQDLSSIFDKHTILNNLENNESNKLWSRNGLGLAISNNMVNNLDGTIEVQSTLNEWTHFIISLPFKEPNLNETNKNLQPSLPEQTLIPTEMEQPDFQLPEVVIDKSKRTLLVIDDEIEILWFIADIFSEKYNVIPISSSLEVESVLKNIHPDIILCDINMPKMDGIELISLIKSNKATSHIPLIIISAKQGVEEQVKGINAGAELYMTKPFNIEYLKSSIERLVDRKSVLKEYFTSARSAYELNDGEFIHNEDSKLISEIQEIIDNNITNSKLNADFIAEKINISTRSLYRRLSNIQCDSISNMIRNRRLYVAESLLVHSQTSIEQIIYSSGFSNRVSFYKAFSKKHNCTPSEYREKNKQLHWV